MTSVGDLQPPTGPAGSVGQLTYASARTGFGIQATSGELTPEESDLLVKGINRDRREFGEAPPAYASPDQVAGFHRNLTVIPTELGVASWLSGPAGVDGSGRPGNVFTHGVLERWRSTSWLMPYGAAEVTGAALPEPFGDDRPTVNRQSVCDFIRDPDAWRLGSLCQILDSLAADLSTPILIGVATPDEAAQWMGVIGQLLPERLAERLGFSLWEGPASIGSRQLSPRLTFVPEETITAASDAQPGAVVVRTSAEPAPREWSPSDSGRSPFGPLAVALFSFFDDPEPILADLEQIGRRASVSSDRLGWALAMALADRLGDVPELGGPVAAALVSEAPDDLDRWPDLWARTVEVINAEIGTTADDVWQVLAAASGPATPAVDVLRKVHVLRCLDDPAALLTEAVPTNGLGQWRADSDVEVGAAVRRVVEHVGQLGGREGALVVTKAAELVTLESPGAASFGSETSTQLQGAVRRLVLPQLLDAPEEFCARAGTVHNRALDRVIRPALRHAPLEGDGFDRAPGDRLTRGAIDWLYSGPVAWECHGGPSELDVEAAAHFARSGVSGQQWEWARRTILTYAANAEPALTPVADLLSGTIPRGTLTTAEVTSILALGRERVSATTVLETLLTTSIEGAADAAALSRSLAASTDPALSADLRGALQTLNGVLESAYRDASVMDLTTRASRVLTEVARLNAKVRTGLGDYWATQVLAWAPFVEDRVSSPLAPYLGPRVSPDPEHPESVHPDLSLAAHGISDRILATAQDPQFWNLLAEVAAVAVQLEPDWVEPKRATPALMARLGAVPHEGIQPLDAALGLSYAGQDRKALQTCREEILAEFSRTVDVDRDAKRVINGWFDRVTGGTGLSTLFGRRTKTEDEQ